MASGSRIALSRLMQVPRSGLPVSVAKITGQGLTSIAILVALLWTCVIGERVILWRANADAAQVARAMRDLRFKTRRQPAAAPARAPHRRLRADVG
jgi:NCAIR mutase (PurE)-related protein